MINSIRAVRGMPDWSINQSNLFQKIEQSAVQTFTHAGFGQVRLPLLEKTELFIRGVGNATDIVEKEMYSFTDRNEENLCLRPEGTAGLIRAIISNGWWQSGQVCRFQYLGNMFRRERPQKGRYRQFTQFGAETIGSENPLIDIELIQLSKQWFKQLDILPQIKLIINTIGKNNERQKFKTALVEFLTPKLTDLDTDSQNRLQTNPMRILDSKVAKTQDILQNAPQLKNYLSSDSQNIFESIQEGLNQLNIAYEINPSLVRGLDYYNDLVFEWISDDLGSQGTICGGGRYDGLMAELGGKNAPACGFASGLDRIQAILEKNVTPSTEQCDIYIVSLEKYTAYALSIAQRIRNANNHWIVQCDGLLGSFKSQFKKADKSGAKLAIVIAENEFENNSVTVKPLRLEKLFDKVTENSSNQQLVLVENLMDSLVKLID